MKGSIFLGINMRSVEKSMVGLRTIFGQEVIAKFTIINMILNKFWKT